MVAGVANRQLGCMASPGRVSSTSLRGARGSLIDTKIVNMEQGAWIAAVDGANKLNVMTPKCQLVTPRARGVEPRQELVCRFQSFGLRPSSKGDKID